MTGTGRIIDHHQQEQLWKAARLLTSPDEDLRDRALDELKQVEGYLESPLIAYILVTRLNEPNLELRYRIVRFMGDLLDLDSEGPRFSDPVLKEIHFHLTQLNQQAWSLLLEVSSHYFSAEEAVSRILKMSSYAGDELSGIVNDRKQPVRIRQQAVYYCGQIGFLASREVLENLVRRVEKARDSSQRIRTRNDEEELYPYALAALEKMSS